MKSVPPRGSGWVSIPVLFNDRLTRYREVVLTSSDPIELYSERMPASGQSSVSHYFKLASRPLPP